MTTSVIGTATGTATGSAIATAIVSARVVMTTTVTVTMIVGTTETALTGTASVGGAACGMWMLRATR